MKKLNKKAFTLVEIVVAIGILAAASVGIGAIVVAVQNNSQKQFSQGDLQQQLSDVQDSLKNDLLTTNAGVKYWIQDDLGGYVESDGANKNPDRSKIVAMYAMDYIDNTLTRTYVKYDAAEDVLYKAELSETVTFDHSKKMLLDEKPEEVINDSSLDWYLYAQGVSNFSMDLSKYSENQTINYNVNLSSDNTDYESDNTVNIRNEIPINDATILENYDQAIITRPALQKNSFEYNGREITPKQLDVNSRYVEIRVTDPEKDRLSATNVGKYRITYHLKNAVWSDGSAEDYTIEWEIVPRPLSVKWTDYTWIYDGTEHTARYELGNIADTDAMLALVTLHGGTIGPGYGTQTASLEVINSNYVINENASKEIAITKGVAEYTVVPTPASTADNPLVYNGQPQALVNPGSTTCGTIYYSLSANSGFSVDVPKVKSANDETPYIVYYYIKGEGSYADSEIKYMEVVMHRAIPAIDKPVPFDDINYKTYYNGSAQELLYYAGATSAATNSETNLVYSLDGDTYSSELPTGVTAKQYTVWYKSKKTADFEETIPQYVEAKILKAERPLDSFTLPQANSLVYTGTLQPLFKAGTGTASQAKGWMYKLEDGEWTTTIPEKDAAGNYSVYLKIPETADYAEYVLETPIIVTIEKAPAQFVLNGQPQMLPNLIYNGQPQNLITNGLTRDGLVYYGISTTSVSPSKENMSIQTPQGTGTGTYYVFYYIKGDDNHLDSDIVCIESEIIAAIPSITTAPIALTGEYTGVEQSLIIMQGQSGSGIPLQYSLTGNDGTWSEIPPSATSAGYYTIYYKVPARENYADSAVDKVIATIAQAETQIVAPQANLTLVYNGTYQPLCIEGETEFGVMEYSVNSQQQWSEELPLAINAGKYDIYWRVLETTDYKGASGKISVTIRKQTVDIVPPEATELTYSGEGQFLLDPYSGSVPPGYHFEYRLSDPAAQWSIVPPMATDAGIYYVEYRVVADNNDAGGNIDTSAQSIAVTILPVTPTVVVCPAKDLVYNSSIHELIDESKTSTNFGELEYSLEQDGMYSHMIPFADTAGLHVVYWRTKESTNLNQQSGSVSVTIDKLKIDYPVVTPLQMQYNGEYQFPEISQNILYVSISEGGDAKRDATTVGYDIVFEITNSSVEWIDGSTDNHTVTWYITKGETLPFTPPVPTPQAFTGEPQLLFSPVEIDEKAGAAYYRLSGFKANGDTQWTEYSEQESPWVTDPPLYTDVGEYKFLYKIESFNYDSLPETEFSTTINKGIMNVTITDTLLDYTGESQQPTIHVDPLGVSSETEGWVQDEEGNAIAQTRVIIEVSKDGGKTWKTYRDKKDPRYDATTCYPGELKPATYSLQVRVTDTYGEYETYIDTTAGFQIQHGVAKWSALPAVLSPTYDGLSHELLSDTEEKTGMHFEYRVADAKYEADGTLKTTSSYSTQSKTIPSKIDAKVYSIKIFAVVEENYKIYTDTGDTLDKQELATVTATIQKAPITIATLPYLQKEILYATTSGQTLGLVTGTLTEKVGTFVYTVEYYATPDSEPEPFKTNASVTINNQKIGYKDSDLKKGHPKPKNPGTYIIRWWVQGDANHEDYYHIVNGEDYSYLSAQIIEVGTDEAKTVTALNAAYTGKKQQLFIVPTSTSYYLSIDGTEWIQNTSANAAKIYELTHKTEVGEYNLYWKPSKSGEVQGPLVATIAHGTLSATYLREVITNNAVERIVFSSNMDASGIAKKWDVSEEQNAGVLAWASEGTLYIVSSATGSKIIAPQNCTELLANFPDIVAVDVSGLDTSNTNNMSYMFYNLGSNVVDKDVHIIGLSSFKTVSVNNASHMFENAAKNTNAVYAPFLQQLTFAAGADKTDWLKNFGLNATIKEFGLPPNTETSDKGDSISLLDGLVYMYAGSLASETLIAAQWSATYEGTPVECTPIDYLRVTTPYIEDGEYLFTGILKTIQGDTIELEVKGDIVLIAEKIEADTSVDGNVLTMHAKSMANKHIVTGDWTVLYNEFPLPTSQFVIADALTVKVTFENMGTFVFNGTLVDNEGKVHKVSIEVILSSEQEEEIT